MVKINRIILYLVFLSGMISVLLISKNKQFPYNYKNRCIVQNTNLETLAPGFFKIKNRENTYLSITDRKNIKGIDVLKIELAENGIFKESFYLARGKECLTMSL